jgi:hypothetical protein
MESGAISLGGGGNCGMRRNIVLPDRKAEYSTRSPHL